MHFVSVNLCILLKQFSNVTKIGLRLVVYVDVLICAEMGLLALVRFGSDVWFAVSPEPERDPTPRLGCYLDGLGFGLVGIPYPSSAKCPGI